MTNVAETRTGTGLAVSFRVLRWSSRRPLLRKVLVGGVAIAAAVAGPAANAWEKDVHYGLTKWLALQVGFSADDAERIAKADQDVDDSLVTDPVIGTVLASCVGSDDPASSSVHDHHFPSEVDPPASASRRAVKPGEVWEHGYLRPLPKLDPKDPNYTQLGQYLHAFQDSWSHQGLPDVPSHCSDVDRGWGHAVKRGGWACHLADLTYKWSGDDARAMAKGTYEVLVKAHGGSSNTTWEKLEVAVDDFSKAGTKLDKDKWFAKEPRIDRHFLQVVSLPDCGPAMPNCYGSDLDQLIRQWDRLTSKAQASTGIAPGAVAFVREFLQDITEGAKAKATEKIDRRLAAEALARALHVSGVCEPLYDKLLDSMIGQGFLTGRGGQQPLGVCELAMQVQSGTDSKIPCAAAVASVETWLRDVMPRGPGLLTVRDKQPKVTTFSYFIIPGPTKGEYLALANFVHLPADQLVIGVKNADGGYKITSLTWQPDEGLSRRVPPRPVRVSAGQPGKVTHPPAKLASRSTGGPLN